MSTPSDIGSISGIGSTPGSSTRRRRLYFQGRADPALARRLDEEFAEIDGGLINEGKAEMDVDPMALPAGPQAPFIGPALPPDWVFRRARVTDPKAWDFETCYAIISKEYPGLEASIAALDDGAIVKSIASLTNIIAREIVRRKRNQSYVRKQYTGVWRKINTTASTARAAQSRYKKIYQSKKRQADWMNHLRSKAYAFK